MVVRMLTACHLGEGKVLSFQTAFEKVYTTALMNLRVDMKEYWMALLIRLASCLVTMKDLMTV